MRLPWSHNDTHVERTDPTLASVQQQLLLLLLLYYYYIIIIIIITFYYAIGPTVSKTEQCS